MHNLIASYLFQHKQCPLPGLGELTIGESVAQSDFTNKSILAPVPKIYFRAGVTNNTSFINYAASQMACSQEQAASAFDTYCGDIKTRLSGSVTSIDGIGNFSVNGNGDILFNAENINPLFVQPVPAERVIRREASHDMLVGDKQTTNIEMNEYFNEEKEKKDRWWIWAIILGLIGIITVLIKSNFFHDPLF